MSQNHIICFLGRNGSGKTYQSNQLVKKGYTKISLADPVRELAWKSLGWRPENTGEYNSFKECSVSVIKPNFFWYLMGTDDMIAAKANFTSEITGRQYLQNLGEGAKDLFGEDFWVKAWEEKIKENLLITGELIVEKSKVTILETNESGKIIKLKFDECLINKSFIVTDDIRFPIEIETAHKLGATFIWCDYQKGNYPTEEHSSEALANRILAIGKYEDGDEIRYEDLQTFFD